MARRGCLTALLVLILVPSAQAGVTSGLATVDRLVGECDATIDVVPRLTRLMFDEQLSAPLEGFLAGSQLVVQEAAGTDAHVRRTGPAGNGPLYSHQDTAIGDSHEYADFRLDLSTYFSGARISILSSNPGWSEATLSHGFDMSVVTPGASTSGAGDPRHDFDSEPAVPILLAAVNELSVAGDLRILVEQAVFTVHSGDAQDEFEARDSSLIDNEVDAEDVRYFVLLVKDARLVITDTIVSAEFFASIANIHCVGALLDSSAADPVIIAEGVLDVSPREDNGSLLVPYTITLPDNATSQATNVGIAPSAFPYWGIFVALGFVATGGGAAAWHFSRRVPRAASLPSTPTPASAPAKPGPRSVAELETAYRADPANAVLAMELGLAYARKAQPHDALPLLQMAIQHYPKMDTVRYFAGIALLEIGRIDDALVHLSYAFRLNPLNVARFINEGAAHAHGHHARVRAMLARWSRQFQESNARGYA